MRMSPYAERLSLSRPYTMPQDSASSTAAGDTWWHADFLTAVCSNAALFLAKMSALAVSSLMLQYTNRRERTVSFKNEIFIYYVKD